MRGAGNIDQCLKHLSSMHKDLVSVSHAWEDLCIWGVLVSDEGSRNKLMKILNEHIVYGHGIVLLGTVFEAYLRLVFDKF